MATNAYRLFDWTWCKHTGRSIRKHTQYNLTPLWIPFPLLLRAESLRLPGRYLSSTTYTLSTFLDWFITYEEDGLAILLKCPGGSRLKHVNSSCTNSSRTLTDGLCACAGPFFSRRDNNSDLIPDLSFPYLDNEGGNLWFSWPKLRISPNHHPWPDMKRKDVREQLLFSGAILSLSLDVSFVAGGLLNSATCFSGLYQTVVLFFPVAFW